MSQIKVHAHLSALTDEEIDAGLHAAENIYDEILATINEAAIDSGTVHFALWTFFTRMLVENGWTPEGLAREAAYHAADQTSDGGVQ
jgi:hypothetical protein